MASKAEQEIHEKARCLAEAIKGDILGKMKPKKLYRNWDGYTIMSFDRSGPDMLHMTTVLRPNYDIASDAIDRAIEKIIVDDDTCLRTGCWGMSQSPVGTVKELTEDEVRELVKQNVKKVADAFQKRLEYHVLECLALVGDYEPDETDSV